jgi:hypothetical protein
MIPELSALATGLVAVMAIFVALRRLWRRRVVPGIEQIGRATVVLNGRPAIRDETGRVVADPIPGALQRFDFLEKQAECIIGQLHSIDKELHPNGGETLRDAVARTEVKVTGIETWMVDTEARLDRGSQKIRRLEEPK